MGKVLAMPHRGDVSCARQHRLYHWPQYDAFECLACGEMIEIPWKAVLKGGAAPVRVKEDPENLLVWRELMELDHEKCGEFGDAEKARQAREFRR